MNWPDVEGRMIRDHVDVDIVLDEPLYVFVALLVSYAIDDLVSFERPRIVARRVLFWSLAHPGEVPTDEAIEADGATDDPEVDVSLEVSKERFDTDPVAAANAKAANMWGVG